MSNTTSAGLFMPVIDWSDPKFAEWQLSKLDNNAAQRDMFLTHDPDDGFLDLTVEQRTQLCLTVKCKVDLGHSNVCVGVEKNWPNQMFGQKDFQSLRPEQKQQINDEMQRSGAKLYKKYVNENALAERLKERTNDTLAPFLELNYRKNLFQRMAAHGTSAMDIDIDINDNVKTGNVFWKKESVSLFADPFASVAAKCIKQWNDELNELKSAIGRSQKCNAEAMKLMHCGETEYNASDWNEALGAYHQALCFAEPGSTCEGLAYGRRGNCFYQLGLFHDAIADFKLAVQKMCPDQYLSATRDLRAKCAKQAKNRFKVKTTVPKMKLPANAQFPCLANVLDVQYIDGYGRCVIATANIGVGQTIFLAETFASVTMGDNQPHCYTCHHTGQLNFIPCPSCSDVMFCSESCANNRAIHNMDCQTIFHRIDNIDVRFVIRTVLVAIGMFPSVDDLMTFVESCMANRSHDEIPKSTNDPTSKYGVFLKLTPQYNDRNVFYAYQAYTCILLMPKIKQLFDTELKQRFLMQLVVHHAVTIVKNVFRDHDGQHTAEYIFDVMSFINHSCAPNVDLNATGNIGHGVTIRPIKKGEQVVFSYIGDDENLPTDERQRKLMDWEFLCKCTKCEGGQ